MFFDGSNVDEKEAKQFEDLPEGEHVAMITSLTKKTSDNNPVNKMFKVEFQVVSGVGKGRHHWEHFLYEAANPKAAQIGKAKMKLLCLAICGRPSIEGPQDVVGKPFKLILKNQRQQDGAFKARFSDAVSLSEPTVTRTTQSYSGSSEIPF